MQTILDTTTSYHILDPHTRREALVTHDPAEGAILSCWRDSHFDTPFFTVESLTYPEARTLADAWVTTPEEEAWT